MPCHASLTPDSDGLRAYYPLVYYLVVLVQQLPSPEVPRGLRVASVPGQPPVVPWALPCSAASLPVRCSAAVSPPCSVHGNRMSLFNVTLVPGWTNRPKSCRVTNCHTSSGPPYTAPSGGVYAYVVSVPTVCASRPAPSALCSAYQAKAQNSRNF